MYIYILLLFCSLTAVESWSLWNTLTQLIKNTHDKYVPEDATLNITELALKYGCPLEEHTVITEDGYLLNIHRIPSKLEENVPVVFLMHGILESSDSWLLMGPDKALGYVLMEQGFDVWMGNTRGNKHAQRHTTFNYTMTQFWNYEWEDIAVFDLPAMIDYILKQTGQDSLYYVGHSQGTTTGYVLCALKPEYNNKIKIMFSLAPEAWMSYVRSPIVKMFSPAHDFLRKLLSNLNIYTAGQNFFNTISAFVCGVLPDGCDNMLYLISGRETKINETFLSVILGHMPTGSSILQFAHYGQLVQSGRFCRFDYGKERNLKKYGMSAPPDYNLREVTVPVFIFYSSKDWLSDPRDVEILMGQLSDVDEKIFLRDFTHIDYIYAIDAVDIIYKTIIRRIGEYELQFLLETTIISANV